MHGGNNLTKNAVIAVAMVVVMVVTHWISTRKFKILDPGVSRWRYSFDNKQECFSNMFRMLNDTVLSSLLVNAPASNGGFPDFTLLQFELQ